MTTKRQLAAIMFTDIVGYTAMMHSDERNAATVRQRHRDVFQQEHVRYNGEILQYYGDGTLSIFKSSVEAVECGISMQQQFKVGIEVPLRIGLHLGDIVCHENEVYGDGVNLASRVESAGVPGCILISDKLQYSIKNHNSISTKSLGFFDFKNINDPVEIFAVTNAGIKVPDRSELKGKLKQNKKSVAVLPFVNMSSDPENEYFSDGISEEILNALVRVEGLSVTARTSSFAFKGRNMDVREIGTQLGVGHILEGSVRKAGNRVRITAQLVSSVDGYHFFSETYDRTLEDIFEVQDEIASTITNRLREHLSEKEHEAKMVTASTLNMEAYETYLRGLFYSNQFADDQAMTKAIPYLEQAIEMEPEFVLPYEKLGICYFFQAMGGKVPMTEAKVKMTAVFEKLQKLGIETAAGYFAIGIFNIFVRWDFVTAAQVAKEGLARFPNGANLYHLASTLYWIKSDLDSTSRIHRVGLDLDPLSIEMIFYMGVSHLWQYQFEIATPYFEKVVTMVPEHRAAREYMGWIDALQGHYDQALHRFEKLEAFGYRLHRSTCLGWTYAKMGVMEKAHEYIEEVKNYYQQSPQGLNLSMDLAILYTVIHDFDNAFHYLEESITNRIGSVMMFGGDPLITPLNVDPRFQNMIDLLGDMPDLDFLEDHT